MAIYTSAMGVVASMGMLIVQVSRTVAVQPVNTVHIVAGSVADHAGAVGVGIEATAVAHHAGTLLDVQDSPGHLQQRGMARVRRGRGRAAGTRVGVHIQVLQVVLWRRVVVHTCGVVAMRRHALPWRRHHAAERGINTGGAVMVLLDAGVGTATLQARACIVARRLVGILTGR